MRSSYASMFVPEYGQLFKASAGLALVFMRLIEFRFIVYDEGAYAQLSKSGSRFG